MSSHEKFGLNLEIGVWQPAVGAITVGLQNSGSLCAYDPELGMFIPISGTFCPYFPMNGLERRHFLAVEANSGINYLYFSQMDGFLQNSDILCPYFFLWSFQATGFRRFS
ncbi:hypothetical protein [Paenibacillus sp. TH7-28]